MCCAVAKNQCGGKDVAELAVVAIVENQRGDKDVSDLRSLVVDFPDQDAVSW